MPKSLSIIEKQHLSKDSNSSLKWEVIDSVDRKIVMGVCFDGSPEIARKHLGMSVGGFYKRWKYLKEVYHEILNNFPTQAINIMKGYSIQAAQTLGQSLEAQNPADQIKAANSILDRVTPEREEVRKGSYRKITFEEWIKMPEEERNRFRESQKG